MFGRGQTDEQDEECVGEWNVRTGEGGEGERIGREGGAGERESEVDKCGDCE